MSANVITFPNMTYVGGDTGTPLEVIVAPLGEDMVAWVRSERGCAVLEQTPDWRHALKDGYAYAIRHGVPLRMQGAPLDTSKPERGELRGGKLYVEPSSRDGGSWDITHISRSEDSAAIVGNRFSYDEAEAEACRIAIEIGAVYEGASTGVEAVP